MRCSFLRWWSSSAISDKWREPIMNAHVSAILLGVKDMERSKRFYMDRRLERPGRLQDLGLLRSPRRLADRLLRPRGPRRQWFQWRGLQLRRAQRGTRRRDPGGGEEDRREDPQARGEATVGRIWRVL